jgi:TolB protein
LVEHEALLCLNVALQYNAAGVQAAGSGFLGGALPVRRDTGNTVTIIGFHGHAGLDILLFCRDFLAMTQKQIFTPDRRRLALLAALVSVPALPAWAQFRVEVSGVGLTQLPIALPPFRGEEAAPQPISAIVRADLERSGQFRAVDVGGLVLDETTRADVVFWRQRSADALVGGSVKRLADGRWDVRFRLWDVVKDQDLGNQDLVKDRDRGGLGWLVSQADLRLAAHKIADYIYEKLIGDKGVFSTRLAFVTRAAGRHTLWVSDADGENAQAALSSSEPIISPAWSPSGTQLAYVSFESRKPVVYVHDIATGKRRLLANFRGSNSAPAWSPDDRSLAVTLSRDGGSQIYLISASGGEPSRLTQSPSIDTEPRFSPDGSTLYFVSDRGGAPQIYRMPVAGGPAQRVTFSGDYNVSPALSPDGRWLAYISRVGRGSYSLQVMELASGNVSSITDTTDDQSPSFAPNSRLIVYATRQGGREALMTTTVDGKVKARLGGQGGDIREPAWGPFQR